MNEGSLGLIAFSLALFILVQIIVIIRFRKLKKKKGATPGILQIEDFFDHFCCCLEITVEVEDIVVLKPYDRGNKAKNKTVDKPSIRRKRIRRRKD